MASLAWIQAAPLAQALGWTLLHSLWQAALVALIVKALFTALAHKKAMYRYTLALLAIASLLIWSRATFFQHYVDESVKAFIQDNRLAPLIEADSPLLSIASSPKKPLTTENYHKSWLDHLQPVFPWFCLLWALGVLLLGYRFGKNILYLRQLRRTAHPPLSDFWMDKLAIFSKALGLRRQVQLRESTHVREPLTLGFLKPLILFPLGLVNQLSIQQTEAVLLHELAHIRRADFLINLLQSCTEVLFFFNPAIHWLSAQLRKERELCCDDLVLAYGKEPMPYAEALLQVQRMSSEPPLTMQMSGRRGELSRRIHRLFGGEKPQPHRWWAFVLASLLVGSLLLVTVNIWKPQNGYVTITGEILDANPAQKAYVAVSYDEQYFGQQKKIYARIDENRRFTLKLPIFYAQEINLNYDFRDRPILVKPGDKMRIVTNNTGPYEYTRTYAFGGSGEVINNTISKYLSDRDFELNYNSVSVSNMARGSSMSLETFQDTLFKLYVKEQVKLENFIRLEAQDSLFGEWAHYRLDYIMAYWLMVRDPSLLFDKKQTQQHRAFYERIPVNNPNATIAFAYQKFLEAFSRKLINAKNMQNNSIFRFIGQLIERYILNQKRKWDYDRLRKFEKQLDPQFQDLFRLRSIQSHARSIRILPNNFGAKDHFLKKLKLEYRKSSSMIRNPYVTRMAQDIYENTKIKHQTGEAVVEGKTIIDLPDSIDGKDLLSFLHHNHKGQYLWIQYASPKMYGRTLLKKPKQMLKKDTLTFVHLLEKEKWESDVKEETESGHYYLLSKKQCQQFEQLLPPFLHEYSYSIILDKEGKFAEESATWLPSISDLQALIHQKIPAQYKQVINEKGPRLFPKSWKFTINGRKTRHLLDRKDLINFLAERSAILKIDEFQLADTLTKSTNKYDNADENRYQIERIKGSIRLANGQTFDFDASNFHSIDLYIPYPQIRGDTPQIKDLRLEIYKQDVLTRMLPYTNKGKIIKAPAIVRTISILKKDMTEPSQDKRTSSFIIDQNTSVEAFEAQLTKVVENYGYDFNFSEVGLDKKGRIRKLAGTIKSLSGVDVTFEESHFDSLRIYIHPRRENNRRRAYPLRVYHPDRIKMYRVVTPK